VIEQLAQRRLGPISVDTRRPRWRAPPAAGRDRERRSRARVDPTHAGRGGRGRGRDSHAHARHARDHGLARHLSARGAGSPPSSGRPRPGRSRAAWSGAHRRRSGFGFAKTPAQNFRLLDSWQPWCVGYPVAVGPSRKRFRGTPPAAGGRRTGRRRCVRPRLGAGALGFGSTTPPWRAKRCRWRAPRRAHGELRSLPLLTRASAGTCRDRPGRVRITSSCCSSWDAAMQDRGGVMISRSRTSRPCSPVQ